MRVVSLCRIEPVAVRTLVFHEVLLTECVPCLVYDGESSERIGVVFLSRYY
jgi:hypothetical protein